MPSLVRVLVALAFVVALAAPAVQAQPADWGEIPDTHADLTVYAADSSASAVVLFDVGMMTLDRGVEFERHRRVKLFSEAGYEHATVSFFVYARDRVQYAEDIAAQTFVPDGMGGYRHVEMDDDAVFQERVGDTYQRVTFTLPALEPGAIFEYRYRTDSEAINLLPTWRFQDDIPTIHSEIEVRSMTRRSYAAQTQGAAPYDVEESGTRRSYDGRQGYNRWVRTDVPAFREEPFMAARQDYIYKLEFLMGDGGAERWRALAEYLHERDRFGGELRSTRQVRELVDEATQGHTEPLARARAIHDYVRRTYEHNGWRGIWTSRRAGELLETRRGGVASINLLLTQLLREADLEAHPALVATRGFGRMRPYIATLSQFNYVVTRLTLPDTTLWLDATDPLLPFGMLPRQARRGKAWVVDEDRPEWVPVTVPMRATEALTVDAHLSGTGALTSHLRFRAEGYEALDARTAIREGGLRSFVEALAQGLPGATIDSSRVVHLDEPEQPLEIYATVRAEGYAQTADDLLFFNPVVLQRQGASPFRSPERTYPVDFGDTTEKRLTVQVHLPEGYVVDEMPEATAFRMPGGGLHYTCRLTAGDGRLLVRRKATREVTRIETDAYPDLRAFYDRVAAAEEGMVVLRRTPDGG
ncbi:MAG: DUF3857 domain-containing protein [Bacteroidota bacterium]